MRVPLVCGVAGGVGATTIAAALGARDLGVYRGGTADIVVCRSTSMSVGAAHRVVNAIPGKPVLVVVTDGPLRTPAAVKARVTMVGPHVAAVVWMPYVEHWRQIDDVIAQAVAAPRHPDRVPKWLQSCGFRRNGALSPEVLEHLFRWYWCSTGVWGRSVSDGLVAESPPSGCVVC